MPLPADATVATVLHKLRNPATYLGRMIERLQQCHMVHGNAFVRIGTSGTGKCPYYRIGYLESDGQEKIYNSYFDNGTSFSDEGRAVDRKGTWSTGTTVIDDVAALMPK